MDDEIKEIVGPKVVRRLTLTRFRHVICREYIKQIGFEDGDQDKWVAECPRCNIVGTYKKHHTEDGFFAEFEGDYEPRKGAKW